MFVVPTLGLSLLDSKLSQKNSKNADSPQLNDSFSSNSSEGAGNTINACRCAGISGGKDQSSEASDKPPDNSEQFHNNIDMNPPNHPYDMTEINIEEFCLGTPQKIGQSHTGAVEISVSLQEKALFLPTVRKTSRSSRSQRHSQTESHTHHRNSIINSATESANFDPDSHNNGLSDRIDRLNTNSTEYGHDEDPSMPRASSPNENENRTSSNQRPETPSQTNHESRRSDDLTDELNSTPCSTLRGSVLLKLNKPMKIKEVSLNFHCMSRTLWNLLPQTSVLADATLPNTAQVEDTAYLGIHHWDFVPLEHFGTIQSQYEKSHNSQSATLIGQDLYGADVALFKDQPHILQKRKLTRIYNSRTCRLRGPEKLPVPVFSPLHSQPRKLKPSTVHSDGVLFPAGAYVYNFTLLVDAKTPASVNVPNGEVKSVLGVKVVRCGAFSPNVSGQLEVDVVRASLEGSSDSSMFAPWGDSVFLSRVWEDSFVYSVDLDCRNITLDVPVKLTLKLLPLCHAEVTIHQFQLYLLESVTYIYSLDPSIRYVDNDLKLLLYQKNASDSENNGNLLHTTEVTTISTYITLCSEFNKSPEKAALQPFFRGRFGETRYIKPDVKGPYVRVKHRIQAVLWVSRLSKSGNSMERFEVKMESPINVQSRHCVAENIRLPTYTVDCAGDSNSPTTELPPSFDDAMEHELLGPQCVQTTSFEDVKERQEEN